MSDLRFHRVVAALLAVCLLLTSLEVLWADAAGAEDGSAAAVVAAGATPIDASAAPPEEAEDDCFCLCACACVNAQLVALPTRPAPPPVTPRSTPRVALLATLADGEPPAHWRPPRA